MTPAEKTLEILFENRRPKRTAPRPIFLVNGLFRAILSFAVLLLVLVVATPIVALLLHASPAKILQCLKTPSTLDALQVTAVTSAASTLAVFLLGLPVAYALSRHLGKGRPMLETVLELPMVMPPVVAGLGLLLAFGRRGLVGSFLFPMGIQIPFSLAAVVLAQVFVITPFFVKRTTVLFDGVDQQLETAAMLLGAGPFTTFFRVTLPLCRRGLCAEAVMVLAQGIGLFGAVMLFAGNLPQRTQTLSLAVYGAFEKDPEQAFTLAALMLLLCCALLLCGRMLQVAHDPGRRP
jgi:molybdate transport system permease protein